jgi:bifunctional UDP-N-acetylglucosamine pyrophosphorylase/glucosamine-1-phosphate N-acetyltransferase
MFTSVILAAGMGTRMKSDMPKVLHSVCGKPLCGWVIDASLKAGADEVVCVVGHKADMVKEKLAGKAEFVLQAEQKGTGHAVMQAKNAIENTAGAVVVLNGDTPLITADMIKSAVCTHEKSGASATVITAELDDATGYGRIVRGTDGSVLKIVEQKDASEEERNIHEVNSGMYVFSSKDLLYALDKITPNNAQGEYYLTDTLEILRNAGKKVGAYVIDDADEIRGINDRVQLSEAQKLMQIRINEAHMRNGVTMLSPETTCIEDDVQIGGDTIIGANVIIGAGSKIGSNVSVGANSQIMNSVVHDGADILCSVMFDAEIGKDTHVGPFAYLRPNSVVGKNVKVGDFVEIKNSNIGDGTKISHLTYIGDSDVGENVNFGCGTVTVNYDGKSKYRTKIGNNAFIGCNTNLVAPVTVADGAYTAAGSTITDAVPEDSLAIARARQVNKTDWNDKRSK